MSKLAHSNDDTMAVIERRAQIDDGNWTLDDEAAYYKAQNMALSIKDAKNDPLFVHLLTEAFYLGTKP